MFAALRTREAFGGPSIHRALWVGLLWTALTALAVDARSLVPWLEAPTAWSRHVEQGVVSLMPNDLGHGQSWLLMVEPVSKSKDSAPAAYDKALKDLGPWEPIGAPVDAQAGGWTYRQGMGVATLNGARLIAHTIVARRGNQMVRMWVLADSDTTYNRYKDAIGTAMASVQDAGKPASQTAGQAAPAVAAAPAPAPPTTGPAAELPAGFGQGLSGVYVGLERGVGAGAGIGHQVTSQIGDAMEVDVLYPDGTYRRRLPVRGLLSNLHWERQQQPPLWGTWQKQGSQVIVKRGSYTAAYRIDGQNLISDRGRPCVKLALHSGLRLDGSFARSDYREPRAPRLILRADGSYEERDDFLRMVSSAWNLVVPDADAMRGRWNDGQFNQAMAASRGTYAFENFTLTLFASDGRIWMVNAYVPPGEAVPRPRGLVVNGRVLARD